MGSLHRRSLLAGGQRFDTSFRITADFEFLLRRGPALRAAFLDHVTAVMPVGGVSDDLRPSLLEFGRARISMGARSAWWVHVQVEMAYARGKIRRALWY